MESYSIHFAFSFKHSGQQAKKHMVARYGTYQLKCQHYSFLGVTKRRVEHIKCRSPNFVGRLVSYHCFCGLT